MPGRRFFFVYILSNRGRRLLYTGVTRNLRLRVAKHRAGIGSHFTRCYRVWHLVCFEVHESPVSAITREKQIKAGSRRQKIALIATVNPEWRDLWFEL